MNRELALPDGRQLEYRVSGPTAGLPLVFHHGTPGGAPPYRALEAAAHARGLRFVTPARPGYGASTPLPGRAVVDVVADTAALLEALGATRCLVAGWSGGGPHAFACAARLPGTAAALVIGGVAPHAAAGLDWLAGMGEDNLTEFGAALEGEAPLRALLDRWGWALGQITPEGIVAALSSLLPPADRRVLAGAFSEDLAAGFHEGLRNGIEGWLEDDLAFVKPWGFETDELAVPVSLWHGESDLMVPLAHGRWLAETVPGAAAHLVPDAGHLSVGLEHLDEIL
ncbi:MAG TPA: alpha/beta hydrolase, partial [Acidimicrobiales bacterium]|nr:alpha/beta hydrolase [Acidimicrobiales bacterium]